MRFPGAALALNGALCLLLAVAAATAAELSREPAGEPATASCAECGMSLEVTGRFTARLVSGADTRYFCDIGDLVAYLERKRPREGVADVRDYPTGEWVAATDAVFVIDKQAYATPMGWGIAAFRDRESAPARALDFAALRQALR